MIDVNRAPFPITIRELWLPRAINGNATLPSSKYNGHPLTLTGARKGTTADGVHFNGAVDSNVNCGAIHNAAAQLVTSLRFKLDQPFSAASPADLMICGKWDTGNDYFVLYLAGATGQLYFEKNTGGAGAISLISAEDSWNAGQWYHVLFSIGQTMAGGAASDGRRLRIDNGIAVTNADATAVCGAGDLVFGDIDDPGGGNGFEGIIADFMVMTDDVTAAEETELYKGIPPADAVNEYPLDEGRGVTAYDRGSGGNNGTLDTTATWAWGECKQPVLSFDGINDHGQSSAGIDITGALSVVWAGKMKSTYDGLVGDHDLWSLFIDNNTYYSLHYNLITGDFRFQATGMGEVGFADYEFNPAIDDYAIIICTHESGVLRFLINGSLVVSGAWAGAMPGLAATAYIGAEDTPSMWDISKPLLVGVFETAFTQEQAKAFSHWLNEILSLGVKI